MKNKTVLVIDDSEDMLALQRLILEGAGFNVFTAQTAAAAFETLSKIVDPTLIILDQQMERRASEVQ
jgi:CheY-like chemotaxis protein